MHRISVNRRELQMCIGGMCLQNKEKHLKSEKLDSVTTQTICICIYAMDFFLTEGVLHEKVRPQNGSFSSHTQAQILLFMPQRDISVPTGMFYPQWEPFWGACLLKKSMCKSLVMCFQQITWHEF